MDVPADNSPATISGRHCQQHTYPATDFHQPIAASLVNIPTVDFTSDPNGSPADSDLRDMQSFRQWWFGEFSYPTH